MTQEMRLREHTLAAYLHRRLHKSQKILMCKSDMDLAKEIVSLLGVTGEINEDDERPRVPSR